MTVKALIKILNYMPEGSQFQVISFGSSWEELKKTKTGLIEGTKANIQWA